MRTRLLLGSLAATGIAGALLVAAGCGSNNAIGSSGDVSTASSTGSSNSSTSSTSSTGAGTSSTTSTTSTSSGGDAGAGGSSSTTSTSSSGAGGAEAGTPPPACAPGDGGSPDDSCGGVFISSATGSDTTGTGTKEAPYASIGRALTGVATPQKLYLCGDFNETVVAMVDVTIYGGMQCSAGWTYPSTGQVSKLTTAADQIPLSLLSTGAAEIHDMAIAAVDSQTAGGSSIGVVFGGSSLTFNNVAIAAGLADHGANGTPLASAAANAGGTGAAPLISCTSGVILGGIAGSSTCAMSTAGGSGGAGLPTSPAGSGVPGQKPASLATGTGSAGVGQVAGSPGTACTAGGNGTTGSQGTSGMPATGIGSISGSGYEGPSATIGGAGIDGEGGGGGGGSIGAADCSSGGAGGGGGAGGCGGLAGNIGAAGGSSIGLIVLGSPAFSFTATTIVTGSGGDGGAGGVAQAGGSGGLAGPPSLGGGCRGGIGGNGGNGGDGPGGAGGHSIAIALTSATLSPLPAGVTAVLGQPGSGGAGSSTGGAPVGPHGVACRVMSFANAPAAMAPCTVP